MPEPHPLVDIQNVTIRFRRKRMLSFMPGGASGRFRAVAEADLAIGHGEVVALVGESGSGKTTLGRAVLRLHEPDEGAIVFDGQDITHWRERQLRPIWRRMAVVFQDPLSSLNPRHTIETALAAPLRMAGVGEVRQRVGAALQRVGLPQDAKGRFPHELSGGQLQRIALARALMLSPALLIADEAVSKLDVSVRSQMLNLFKDLQGELGLAFLFITHDLHVAHYLSDRVAVMFFGRIVETAPAEELFRAPLHPYTKALLATLDEDDPTERQSVDPQATGCIYQSQCKRRIAPCREAHPPTRSVGKQHSLACFNPI